MDSFDPLQFTAGLIFLIFFLWLFVTPIIISCKHKQHQRSYDEQLLIKVIGGFHGIETIGAFAITITGLVCCAESGDGTGGYAFGGVFFVLGFLGSIIYSCIPNSYNNILLYRINYSDFNKKFQKWREAAPKIIVAIKCYHVSGGKHRHTIIKYASYHPIIVPFYYDATPSISIEPESSVSALDIRTAIIPHHQSELILQTMVARLYMNYHHLDIRCKAWISKKIPEFYPGDIVIQTKTENEIPYVLQNRLRKIYGAFGNSLSYIILISSYLSRSKCVIVKHFSLVAPVVDINFAKINSVLVNTQPQGPVLNPDEVIKSEWMPPGYKNFYEADDYIKKTIKTAKPMIFNIRPFLTRSFVNELEYYNEKNTVHPEDVELYYDPNTDIEELIKPIPIEQIDPNCYLKIGQSITADSSLEEIHISSNLENNNNRITPVTLLNDFPFSIKEEDIKTENYKNGNEISIATPPVLINSEETGNTNEIPVISSYGITPSSFF